MTDPERRWQLFCAIAGVRDSELHTALENAMNHFKSSKKPPEWVGETLVAYYRCCEFAQTRFDAAGVDSTQRT